MNGISILMYHRVGRFGPVSNHRALFCDHRQFAAQMAYLNYMRYQVLSMDEALNLLRGNQPLPRRAVALTFDDGYQDFRDYALPTLARYGFPATVYAIAGDIGQRAHWLTTDGMEAAPLLDAAGLREIQAAGITVGSHARSHSRMAELAPEEQAAQARDSRTLLEDLLGAPVRHFCYPYGSYNAASLAAVEQAGYHSAVTCLRATATAAFDPLALPRKAISYGDNLLGYFWKLQMKHRPKSEPLRRA